MLLQSTGHIWTKEEVEATTDLQREFNNYLDSFVPIVSYAAQIYGFYHEIGQLVDNMGGLVVRCCPSCQRTCRSPVSRSATRYTARADYEQHRDS